MHQLSSCARCSGFIPLASPLCPNCDVTFVAAPPSPRRLRGLGRRLLLLAGSSALMTTLMACYGVPPSYRPPSSAPGACAPDADSDGFCPPQDCDDQAAATYPGAPDADGDGIDQDCSGADGTTPTSAP